MGHFSVSNLSKHFGALVAVDEVSFAVDEGELVSILGPSGSGKSTILRMIAGFERPTEGDISLSGENITETPPFERDVNMVFQDLALFPHLDVQENIEYGLKQSGVPSSERAKKVDEMLEMVELEGYNDRNPSELSGGEQQRVAIARALVNEPELILLDEPLSSLDRKLRQHMQTELQRIQEETGITFIYVTHDQEVAQSISDRLVVLNDGEIEQVGDVETLYEEPNSKFVADFLGDVNIFSLEIAERTDDTLVFEEEQTLALRRPYTAGRTREGDVVDVCIRPHHLEISTGDSDSLLAGEVVEKGYRGADTVYMVETSVGKLTVKSRDRSFKIGGAVGLSWDTAKTFVYGNMEA